MIGKDVDEFPENSDRLTGTIDIWWIVRILSVPLHLGQSSVLCLNSTEILECCSIISYWTIAVLSATASMATRSSCIGSVFVEFRVLISWFFLLPISQWTISWQCRLDTKSFQSLERKWAADFDVCADRIAALIYRFSCASLPSLQVTEQKGHCYWVDKCMLTQSLHSLKYIYTPLNLLSRFIYTHLFHVMLKYWYQ